MSSEISSPNTNLANEEVSRISASTKERLYINAETPRSRSVCGRGSAEINRCNYLAIAKLVIRKLIDSSLRQGRIINDECRELSQFFIVMEHILEHRVKEKGVAFLREKQSFWSVIEQLPKVYPDASDITSSVKDMPSIKSSLGRVRAWLRLALMQKKLADYIHVVVDRKGELLLDNYETGAFLLEDEGAVLSGLLVGLNVIDFNFDVKDCALDDPIGVIDYGTYLDTFAKKTDEEVNETVVEMTTILDQKNYIEELNRHLSSTVDNLQQQVKMLSTKNELTNESLAIANNNVLQLQAELAELRKHQVFPEASSQSKDGSENTDAAAKDETAVVSNAAYKQLERRLKEETQTRLDVERELELQIGMKQEAEMALRLLEKDVHEKQDAVIGLRKQLDEVKDIHLSMAKELQEKESSLAHRTDMVQRLEEKSNQMAQSLADVEQKMKEIQVEKDAAEQTCRKLGDQLSDKDTKRTALETDLKIEREWRASLQQQLTSEKDRNNRMQQEVQNHNSLKKDHNELLQRFTELQKICSEQEETLRDLGSHLSESKLQMEDLKEEQAAMRDAQWTDDKEVTNCTACTKPFSVARRKHHCRNCGEIFCNDCSDHKIPLPSSAKPVRVCDACVVRLQIK